MSSRDHPGQTTHGATAVLRRLRDGDLDMRLGPGRQIREMALRLARDLGANRVDDLSAQQQVLVRRVAVKEVVLRLIESYALAGNVIGKNGRLVSPLAEHYLAYSNSIRLDLVALGLERRTKEATVDLATHLRQRYGKPEVGA